MRWKPFFGFSMLGSCRGGLVWSFLHCGAALGLFLSAVEHQTNCSIGAGVLVRWWVANGRSFGGRECAIHDAMFKTLFRETIMGRLPEDESVVFPHIFYVSSNGSVLDRWNTGLIIIHTGRTQHQHFCEREKNLPW